MRLILLLAIADVSAPSLDLLRTALDGASGRFHRSSPPCCGREPGPPYEGDITWELHVTSSGCQLALEHHETASRSPSGASCELRQHETLELAALSSVKLTKFPESDGKALLTSTGLSVVASVPIAIESARSGCGDSESRLVASTATQLVLRGIEATRARSIADALRSAARACGARVR
jgi:hypothetical protein